MDSTKEQEILALGVRKWELCNINTMMDGGYVIEIRRPV
jgi:hypothetical protein